MRDDFQGVQERSSSPVYSPNGSRSPRPRVCSVRMVEMLGRSETMTSLGEKELLEVAATSLDRALVGP